MALFTAHTLLMVIHVQGEAACAQSKLRRRMAGMSLQSLSHEHAQLSS
jgi:hypothetical protein